MEKRPCQLEEMTKIESSIREIAYPQQSVYNLLSDLSNIDKVRDRIPEDSQECVLLPHG